MLLKRPPTVQDLQAHTKAQLLLHAEHESIISSHNKALLSDYHQSSLQCRRFGARDRKFAAILVWEKWVGRGWGKMEENHRLRSWANGVSRKNNDYRQAYFSFPSPSPFTSPFILTPAPSDAFSSLPKPLPSLNPWRSIDRWRSIDQDALARQNTPALQATTSHKHKQATKNATPEKKTNAHCMENASHKM